MKGLPPTGTSGLGSPAVSAPSRVPLPPARMTACTRPLLPALALQEAVAFAPHPASPIVEQIADGLLERYLRLPAGVTREFARVRHLKVGVDRTQAIGIELDADVALFRR